MGLWAPMSMTEKNIGNWGDFIPISGVFLTPFRTRGPALYIEIHLAK